MITTHESIHRLPEPARAHRWQHSQRFRTARRRRRQRRVFIGAAVATIGLMASAASASYVVKAGDTLTTIARKTGLSVDRLAKINKLANPDNIDVGQVLVTDSPSSTSTSGASNSGGSTNSTSTSANSRSYTVKSGDNLFRIAAKFGVTIQSIVTLNNLRNADDLNVGQALKVGAANPPKTTGSPGTTAGGGISQASVHPDLLAYPDRLQLVPIFEKWATRNSIPADLLKAMCFQESGWRANATSPSGAYGVCQIMPYEARWLARDVIGVPTLDRANAEDNIRMGARYLHLLLDETGGNVQLALAGYYQGLPSVAERGMYSDTQEYVRLILGFRPYFR